MDYAIHCLICVSHSKFRPDNSTLVIFLRLFFFLKYFLTPSSFKVHRLFHVNHRKTLSKRNSSLTIIFKFNLNFNELNLNKSLH